MENSGPVLLFDGECGLCVRCVSLLLRSDRLGRLRYAPLQGRAAQDFLRARGLSTEDFASAIFVSDWAQRLSVPPVHLTDALFAAMLTVGGAWRLVVWLRFFPRAWREGFYRWVARWRRCFFGVGDAGVLPARFGPERFLQ